MELKEFFKENFLKLEVKDYNGWSFENITTLTIIKKKDDILYVIPSFGEIANSEVSD